MLRVSRGLGSDLPYMHCLRTRRVHTVYGLRVSNYWTNNYLKNTRPKDSFWTLGTRFWCYAWVGAWGVICLTCTVSELAEYIYGLRVSNYWTNNYLKNTRPMDSFWTLGFLTDMYREEFLEIKQQYFVMWFLQCFENSSMFNCNTVDYMFRVKKELKDTLKDTQSRVRFCSVCFSPDETRNSRRAEGDASLFRTIGLCSRRRQNIETPNCKIWPNYSVARLDQSIGPADIHREWDCSLESW
jgi:hypothetical protein